MATITFDTQVAAKTDILRVERRIDALDAKMDTRFEWLEGELKLSRWMLGVVLAAEVMPWLVKLFSSA
ncbi:MAG TPA: hypothetical protein VI457_00790 [Methylococcaceae bacterium]|nr:hypothetical protein [Methylococcaceae bacterium]